MSAGTAGPETLGSLSDEPEIQDPNSQKAKEISGKSPMQIALRRLSKDKVAVVCAFVVLFFVVCAVFAGAIARAFGVSLETGLASEYVDGLNNGLPKPEMGPPNGAFTWDHPMGVAPRTGEDNLAYWLYGCRVSLLIATTATLIASTVGIVTGPAGRLHRRHRRQGPVVLHRHVPDHPVPARGADAGPDPQRALQHLRQLPDDPEGQPGGRPLVLRLDGHRPPDPRRGALAA